MGKIALFLFLTLSTSFARFSHADVHELIRDRSALVEPTEEEVIKVKSAKVILADYALLKHDFHELQSKSEAEIDQWILDQAGYVSVPQSNQSVVNTKIETALDEKGSPLKRKALRPFLYNRALVFETGGGPLIDGKGFGSLNPQQVGHGNGLASTGEAIREFIYQKKVQQIFDHSKSGFKTVANYAVIDWGFNVINADGSQMPAGAVLRQGHTRLSKFVQSSQGNTFLGDEISKRIETVLRTYGITSSGETWQGHERDVVNIQGTPRGELVDFGSFLSKQDFTNPTFAYTNAQSSSAKPLLDPNDKDFPHPDPKLRVPFSIWGDTETARADPKYDNPWIWSHRLAQDLRDGRATRNDVQNHFNLFMNSGQFAREEEGKFASFSAPVGAAPGVATCLKNLFTRH